MQSGIGDLASGLAPADRRWERMDGCGEFADLAGPFFWTTDRVGEGEVARFGFRASQKHCNMRPMCHGGMLATFADIALARGLRMAGDVPAPIPTITLSLDFLAPAPLGAWVEARVTLSRLARSTGFISAMIDADGDPVLRASGVFRHFRNAK
ncbi:PaaI family thioesterase [Novosphingobium sp. ERN07]|uniref:PaaI family thioesterase n=1 Tax=Novosphingobium sp. ERN07 TaxID=2726187 RepID=UPI0014572D89|nr:PaaI family thioesterase [Novosphingobium sp. ERN07]NLR72990.1 PaaI family thioesterase [Novosphingobium sp. ERN07]